MDSSHSIIFVILLTKYSSYQAAIVRISHGELNGTEDVSRMGIAYYSFRGIPYAKPPVGDLRFEVNFFDNYFVPSHNQSLERSST